MSFYIPEKHYLFGDAGYNRQHRSDAVIWGDCKEDILMASPDLINKINSRSIVTAERKTKKQGWLKRLKK